MPLRGGLQGEFSRHGEIYRSDVKQKAGSGSRAHSRRSSASMSLQPVIPWRVALQQGPPPLHRPASECDKVVLPVKQYGEQYNADPVNFNRPPEPLAA
jgi:hypothetical protein